MTRINTNVPSLVAQNRLQTSNRDLQTSLTRLSTGLRINSGSDDPAGLIASEALRSEITSLGKAVSNTQRASQIISTADSALGEVSSLLNDIRGLVVEAANSGALSPDEIAANQLQIDSSLEAINRIAQTTTFQGRRLLDGSLDFVTQGGSNFGTITDLQIDQANLGALGAIDVDIEVVAAATKAEVSTTGIPASTTAAYSTGTINFSAPSADAEAAGTVNFANSFTVGAEATGTINFDDAFTPNAEAGGTLTLGSGVTLDIDAVDGGLADGLKGDSTIIEVVTQVGGDSSASYDADSDTLTLTLVEGDNAAAIVTDLTGDPNFTVAANGGTSGTIAAGDAGTYTGQLTGGSNTTSGTTGFDLTAVNGGAADGAKGNDTDIVLTSGATTGAAYDADNDLLTITVADGDTIADIAAAINNDVGDDFIASNTVNGDYEYDAVDNTAPGSPLTAQLASGTDPTLASSFDIEAVNGGDADGTAGNGVTLNLTSGDTTEAVYDADNDVINITVADGATTADIAAAIDNEGTFITRNVQNGTALFATADLGANDPSLTGGTDATADDVITVTADDATADSDGVSITLNSDNSLDAGTAIASLDTDGNIVVAVSSNGPVNVGAISQAIDDLEGFSAELTATDGDGSYDIVNDTPATTTDLTGGVFGGGLNADLVVQLTGSLGSEVFQFDKGASLDDVIQSINLVSDSTGIQAEDDGGSLKLTSTTYGSESLIDIEVIEEGEGGTFESGLTASRANGKDIRATVNGTSATGDGNTLSINTSTLDLTVTVEEGSDTDVSFSITSGGALFQLGPDVTSNQQARMGIGSVSTSQLGGASGRLYELASGQDKSLTNDINGAARVIDDVINKVTGLRGRLGAFQATTLDSNMVSLNETMANLKEAESSIRDADFAQESANLTRAQILVQSGTNVLGIANQNPQNVLSLLG
ncbi:flagellin N-terminal helical domain-containing protein [Crateriforma spongiae]|uniref:flagellin N-terminal helical domain-containing protein n=1 Tax=Crateriforma spongiae TaxID=2724528 RepID=UPI0014456539|nr:flagellin [Crateriforma spongiae]